MDMKTETLNAWPITAYPTSRKSKPGVVKLLSTPEPPDEATVSRLNRLANQRPFCRLHQVKKHEVL
jgi:hypothetical protein